jgi:hypothetical protein
MPPWVETNPPPSDVGDSGLRARERRFRETGSVEDEGAYLAALVRKGMGKPWERARFRQLSGDPVQPWEALPISYLFLEACDSFGWDGVKPTTDPARVEGNRLVVSHGWHYLQGLAEAVPNLAISVELQRTGSATAPVEGEPVVLVAAGGWVPEDRPGEYEQGFWGFDWSPGTRPDSTIATEVLQATGERPAPHPDARRQSERFYVSMSSYPMYRGPQEANAIGDSVMAGTTQEVEPAIHARAVEWFVAQGAIPYTMGDTQDIAHMRATGEQIGGLSTPELRREYLQWWDAYRQRVLVGVPDIRNARGYPGWSWTEHPVGRLGVPRDPNVVDHGRPFQQDHNSKILFPHLWEKARLMKRVGKRWKNPRRFR